jgi:hypothetical protein
MSKMLTPGADRPPAPRRRRGGMCRCRLIQPPVCAAMLHNCKNIFEIADSEDNNLQKMDILKFYLSRRRYS